MDALHEILDSLKKAHDDDALRKLQDEAQQKGEAKEKNEGDKPLTLNSPQTKMDTTNFVQSFENNFWVMDRDRSGFVDDLEINRLKQDPSFSITNRELVGVLSSRYDTLKRMHNDGIFTDGNGISLADIHDLAYAKEHGLGFGQALKHGFLDDIGTDLKGLAMAGILMYAFRKQSLRSIGQTLGVAYLGIGLGESVYWETSVRPKLQTMLKELG